MIDEHVGNYRIVRKLGAGGMGVVFEGVHDQIGRRVAIKMLHPELSRHADTVSRFLTEARLVSMLHHPGVVYTFEFGQLPDHTAYIIMEYLEGESLAKRLKANGGRLGASVVNLGRQLASALAAAHAQGIVHRDLYAPAKNAPRVSRNVSPQRARAGNRSAANCALVEAIHRASISKPIGLATHRAASGKQTAWIQ